MTIHPILWLLVTSVWVSEFYKNRGTTQILLKNTEVKKVLSKIKVKTKLKNKNGTLKIHECLEQEPDDDP